MLPKDIIGKIKIKKMKKQDNAIIGIYKITSPSGKVYIGQSINIERRFIEYKLLISCQTQIKIYRSLKKYSPENHIFEILEGCNLEQLNEREIYYKKQIIEQLGWKMALFCELYDMGGGPRSEETKRKISNTSKGKIWTQEHRNNHKKALLKRFKNNIKSDKGKPKHNEIGKQNIRKKLWKPIYQYDLQGNFIKEWSSTNEAANFIKVNPTAITRNLKKLSKSSGGYTWEYKKINIY